jgi:putative ABC transport system permease protein
MAFGTILDLTQTAVELGLISAITALALFLSYSMLNVGDLSSDGCCTLGAAVGAVFVISGHPILAIFMAMGSGMLSGLITALLQTKLGINDLLSGIIVNTGLYSINIGIMGGASILNMNRKDTIFTMLGDALKGTPFEGKQVLLIALAAVAITCLFLVVFLKTRLGLAIRATGDNPEMVRSSSINTAMMTIIGLVIANAFTALSGTLMTQSQKSVDINIGTGMVVIALASLLIGNTFIGKSRPIAARAIGAVLGSIIFRMIFMIALRFDIPSFMLKLVSSILVTLAIAGPYLRRQMPLIKRRYFSGNTANAASSVSGANGSGMNSGASDGNSAAAASSVSVTNGSGTISGSANGSNAVAANSAAATEIPDVKNSDLGKGEK